LGVKSTASQDDINKAFREKSRLIHPDKVEQSLISTRARASGDLDSSERKHKPEVYLKRPVDNELRDAVKNASERFSRLGVIASILKGPSRERYDHFLSNGFPAWKGTGYYYARFRPGLLSVLVGLFVILGGIVHYSALYISWNRQRAFVGRYVKQARRAAWGDDPSSSIIPGNFGSARTPVVGMEEASALLNRRQKRLQGKENRKDKDKKNLKSARSTNGHTSYEAGDQASSQRPRKRVQAENGKVLIVDSLGKVFLEAANDDGEVEEYLLDPGEIPRPKMSQTLVIRLPLWIFLKVINLF
jgi:curved DNA-binding protein CbpA